MYTVNYHRWNPRPHIHGPLEVQSTATMGSGDQTFGVANYSGG